MGSKEILFNAIDKNRDLILAAERFIWNHPETGYREWVTNKYLKEKFEQLGYRVTEAGNIPGFYADIDTGVPGPKIAIFGEMDALIIPGHPECDKEKGTVHSCGHNAQSAALLGIAAALAAPGALEGLSGSIRLFAVPAEELIEVEYRSELIRKGVIKALGGKQEFMLRGYLDDCDIAFMIHLGKSFTINNGCNGCLVKRYVFTGKSTHASSPENSVNALYAATNAMNLANAIRETFPDSEKIRFHPIITKGGDSVNVIPNTAVIETYVRGLSFGAMSKVNKKINRAFASAAVGMGCRLTIEDYMGYAPRIEDKNLCRIFEDSARELIPGDQIHTNLGPGSGCTDMGDISCIMPVIHPHIGGAAGSSHSTDYYIADPEMACVTNAKVQLGALVRLLENGAAEAKKVIAEKNVPYSSIEEYDKVRKSFDFNREAVIYNSDGTVTLDFTN